MSRRLRHIVFFYFTENASGEQRSAVGEALATLPPLIPEILRFDYRPTAGISDASADAVMVGEFEDEAAWRRYQDHPEHQRVIRESIAPVRDRLERCQVWIDLPT